MATNKTPILTAVGEHNTEPDLNLVQQLLQEQELQTMSQQPLSQPKEHHGRPRLPERCNPRSQGGTTSPPTPPAPFPVLLLSIPLEPISPFLHFPATEGLALIMGDCFRNFSGSRDLLQQSQMPIHKIPGLLDEARNVINSGRRLAGKLILPFNLQAQHFVFDSLCQPGGLPLPFLQLTRGW